MITPELQLFHTERLQVRPLQDLDLDALCAVYGDAGAMRRVVATRCNHDRSDTDLFAGEILSG